MNPSDFLRDKLKYIREPYRLRVHLAYVLLVVFAWAAEPGPTGFWSGTVLVGLGVLIRAWASGIVKKDEELAVEGPYSLCRNPLYVGNFSIGYGFCFINGNVWSFVALTLYFLLIYPFTVRKEERKLEEFFGREFDRYRREVRRFIPRLSPYRSLGGWSPYQYFVDNMDWLNEGAVLLIWLYTFSLYLP